MLGARGVPRARAVIGCVVMRRERAWGVILRSVCCFCPPRCLPLAPSLIWCCWAQRSGFEKMSFVRRRFCLRTGSSPYKAIQNLGTVEFGLVLVNLWTSSANLGCVPPNLGAVAKLGQLSAKTALSSASFRLCSADFGRCRPSSRPKSSAELRETWAMLGQVRPMSTQKSGEQNTRGTKHIRRNPSSGCQFPGCFPGRPPARSQASLSQRGVVFVYVNHTCNNGGGG